MRTYHFNPLLFSVYLELESKLGVNALFCGSINYFG